jgi:hypothetical protein
MMEFPEEVVDIRNHAIHKAYVDYGILEFGIC